MGKRGPKPEGKVKIKWSSNFAYAIGLIATDGNLSPDGRHISFVSKDRQQINNYLKCLGIKVKIGKNFSGYKHKWAYRVQFGDILFYQYLQSIGIHPAKSKTMGKLKIPDVYFLDFLRGAFDGDGTIYSYWDKRWKSSFMFYTSFASAAPKYIFWLQSEIFRLLSCKGHMKKDGRGSTYQLTYAKADSLKVLKNMYVSKKLVCLERKRLKAEKILGIVGERLGRGLC